MSHSIGNVNFDIPILNASGCWSMNEEQIVELYNSELGGIVAKSCSIFSKSGNDEPNYYKEGDIHFNSKGLPNNGYDYYKKLSAKFTNKPYILSIAYNNIHELLVILDDYDNFLDYSLDRCSLVEINLSCPNVDTRIPGYHLEDIENILIHLKAADYDNIHIGFKLPPYFEIEFIDKLSELLNKYESCFYFIVVSNSIPNGFPTTQDKEPALANLYGGISGKFNKYIALSNVKTFFGTLNRSISIVGCGGIENNEDVLEYFKYGASFVQLASCFYDSSSNKLNIQKINDLIFKYKNPNF
jgi:dihydroorotate dehydrogenase (fumarate)